MTAVASTQKSNLKTGLLAGALAIGMVGVGFAAVPLYRIFCQVTGFGGTTMRVSEAQAATVQAVSKTIVVRFDANQRGLHALIPAARHWRRPPALTVTLAGAGASAGSALPSCGV